RASSSDDRRLPGEAPRGGEPEAASLTKCGFWGPPAPDLGVAPTVEAGDVPVPDVRLQPHARRGRGLPTVIGIGLRLESARREHGSVAARHHTWSARNAEP